MKLFECLSCGNVLYFENRVCGSCGHRTGFRPGLGKLAALEPSGQGWRAVGTDSPVLRFCANAEFDACNWLVESDTDDYCVACRHNGTIPELSDPVRLAGWRELEIAKHRLFYSLLRWKLPLRTRKQDPGHGLVFNFLADPPDRQQVMTGHDAGIITIALTEADDLERERRRLQMGEPYRTLLGHFRHEVGHHFWDLLVRDGGRLQACRAVFGDDTQHYEAALQRHYRDGTPAGWQSDHVSAYATVHPWEDFAETWAHYLHIVDTLEMAAEFDLDVRPRLDHIGGLSTHIAFDPYQAESIDQIVAAWLPFVFAMNSVSRTMGLRDLYPFILSPNVIAKLGFIHGLVSRPMRACGAASCDDIVAV